MKSGAGPSGLFLALTLTQNGVPVRIIDRDATTRTWLRGSGIQPRTLELYHFLGVLPDILSGSKTTRTWCIYGPDGRTVVKTFEKLPFEDPMPAVPYNNILLIGQAHNEEILRAHLEKHGVFVDVDFEQREDGVKARITKRIPDGSPDIQETVEAEWLVGADGARSFVRKQLGITFLGEIQDDPVIIADIEVKGLSEEVRVLAPVGQRMTDVCAVLASLERRWFWRVCIMSPYPETLVFKSA